MMQNFVLSGKSCNTIEFALLCKEVLKKNPEILSLYFSAWTA